MGQNEGLNGEVDSWTRSLYRKLYLFARDPESLDLVVGQDGRIEFSHEGKFIGWMMVDEQGAPTHHGSTPLAKDYTNFCPMVSFGPIAWPASGHNNAGWSFEILGVEISTEEMPVSLAPPVAN